MLSVKDRICSYGLLFIFCSDDEQLYISFRPADDIQSLDKKQYVFSRSGYVCLLTHSPNLPKTTFLSRHVHALTTP